MHQKRYCAGQCGPLIAVNKRMVTVDMEQVCRCDYWNIFVEQFATEPLLRCHHCGSEQTVIPDSVKATIACEGNLVNLQNICNGQKLNGLFIVCHTDAFKR